jgi:hypothetical protein
VNSAKKIKVCSRCNENKKFPADFKTGSRVRWICKPCYRKYENARSKNKARKFIIEYLSLHPCVECGVTDIRVLEFDHTDKKNASIANLVQSGYSINRIQEEINLCEVVCANCHRIRTMTRGNHYRHVLTQ